MATVFKTSGRTLIVENITYAQVFSDVTILYPANFHSLRITGDEAKAVIELMKAAGFAWYADLMINPLRLVVAEEGGAIARLILDGQDRPLMVPVELVACLIGGADPKPEPEPDPDEVSSVGKPARRKKGAE